MLRHCGARRATPSSDRGESLVELLITIVIMGLTFAALLAGLLATSTAAHNNRERTKVSVAMQTWADRTMAPTTPGGALNYASCGEPPSGVIGSLPTGWTASWTLRYIAPATTTTAQPNWSNPSWVGQLACFNDRGIQEITMTLRTAPGTNQIVEKMVVYKRDPRCPSSFNNADLGPC